METLLLNKDSKKILTKVHFEKCFGSNKIIPIDHKFLKDLDFISTNGEVFVNLIMNVQDRLLTDPIIYSKSILLEEINKTNLVKFYRILSRVYQTSLLMTMFCEMKLKFK